MALKRNSGKTMVCKENSNKVTGKSLHWQSTTGRMGNSNGACYRVGKPFPKPVPNTMGRNRNSLGACYRVGKPFSKPVGKLDKFASYAGKRNTNTTRYTVPLSSVSVIKRQNWNAFYYNGRALKGTSNRIFRASCTLFCEVTFVDNELHSFWTKSCSTVKEPHAEIKALEEIRNLEKCRDIWKVEMLLSYSPCANCSDAIIEFKGQRGISIEISLAFTAIFQDSVMQHCQGLQRLDSEPGIMLRVFTENDWVRLARETDVVYHRNKSRKQQDAYWYRRLQEILKKKDVVLDMVIDDSSTLPHPGSTSRTSRKFECFIGTILFLVVVLVITALATKLK